MPADIRKSVRTSEQISRSVLLEIAKQESEDGQRALWQLAQDGGSSVRSVRAKRSNVGSAARRKKIILKVESASVTISFESENVTVDDVLYVLQAAA